MAIGSNDFIDPNSSSDNIGSFFVTNVEEERKKREKYLNDKVPDSYQHGIIPLPSTAKIPIPVQNTNSSNGTNVVLQQQVGQQISDKQINPSVLQEAGQQINSQPVTPLPSYPKGTTNPYIEKPSGVIPLVSDAQRAFDYSQTLEQNTVNGTLIKGDQIKLNVVKAKKDILDQITPYQDKVNQFDKILQTRTALSGLSEADKKTYDTLGGEKAYEENLRKINELEAKASTYDIFLNKTNSDPNYLRNVYVNSQFTTDAQIEAARQQQLSDQIAAAQKEVATDGEQDKVGFFGSVGHSFVENVITTPGAKIKKALGDFLQMPELKDAGVTQLENVQVDMAKHPSWFGLNGEFSNEVGSLIGGFVPTIAAIAAGTAASIISAPATAGSSLTALPALVAEGTAILFAAQGAAEGWAEVYNDAIDKGASREDAQKAASIFGTVNGALQYLGGKTLIDNIPGVAKNALSESVNANAIQSLSDKIVNASIETATTAAKAFIEQGGIQGAAKFSQNATQKIYDQNGQLWADVGTTAFQNGAVAALMSGAGHAITEFPGLKRSIGVTVQPGDRIDPQSQNDAKMLKEMGVLADHNNVQTEKIDKPLVMYRGTVPDDSTRPIKQLGVSYTLNDQVGAADAFAIEASANTSGNQPPIVQTVELKPGSTLVKLPDVYDAKLLDPKDPRIKGADAVELTSTHVQNGEAEIVVLNQGAVIKKSERPAQTLQDLQNKNAEIVKSQDAADAALIQKELNPNTTSRPQNQALMEKAINSGDVAAQKKIYQQMTPEERVSVDFLSPEIKAGADTNSNTVTPDNVIEINGNKHELSGDSLKQYQEAKALHDTYVEKAKANPADEMMQKRAKGSAMELAALKRKLTGELTPRELTVAINKEKTNYVGKQVEVNGKKGTIESPPSFGKFKVKFEDGTVKSFEAADIKDTRTEAQIKSGILSRTESKPYVEQVDAGFKAYLDKIKNKPEYGMSHRPSEYGAGNDITKTKDGEGSIPADFYQHPEYYFNMKDKAYQESFAAIEKMHNKPEQVVTIYRANPKNELNYGDWVTLSKEYAKRSAENGESVHSFKVKAKDIQFAGDDINEFGYFPTDATLKEQYVASQAKQEVKVSTETVNNQQQSSPEPVKTSKVAASIESKAIEKSLTDGFGGLAGYEPITIKDQAERAAKVMENMDQARQMIRGEIPVESGLKGEMLIKAMEDHAIATNDVGLLKEIASSPLVSDTSAHAQAMRILAERNPESPLTAIRNIVNAREKALGGEKSAKEKVGKETATIKKEIAKAAPKKEDWASFIDSIAC